MTEEWMTMVAMKWQPIETAPKDGEDILITGGTYHCDQVGFEISSAPFRRVTIARWATDPYEQWEGDIENEWYKPTHWMPLPKPPEHASTRDSV